MDDQSRVVKAVEIRNGGFVAVGINACESGTGRESHRSARTDRSAGAHREPHALRQPREPSRLSRSAVGACFEPRRGPGDARGTPPVRARGSVHHRNGRRHAADVRRVAPADARRDRRGRARQAGVPLPGGGGPARTNTLGKQFFETATAPLAGPCVVGADGSLATVAGVNHANRALYHLRIRQTFEDKKRSALDAMAYSASVGLTTNLDQTLVARGHGHARSASLDPQPTDALFTLNHFRMYDAWLALHREDKAFIRLQINFLHNQGFIAALGDLDHQLPELRERLKNQFPFFGDDMLRTGGIGEWAAPFAAPGSADYPPSGSSRSALSPRRAGATRTPSPALRQVPPTSSRSSRPTRRWTPNSASRTCAGACSTRTSRRRTSSPGSRT